MAKLSQTMNRLSVIPSNINFFCSFFFVSVWTDFTSGGLAESCRSAVLILKDQLTVREENDL